MPVLFAYREDRFGFRFEVGESALLGRSPDCDLILFDRATSRRHAQILRSDNGYILKDLESTNGTMHNAVRVRGQVPLKRNDEIKVGQEVFLFDPALDVAIGREGVVLIVGDIESRPAGVMIGPTDPDLSALDRAGLAALFQVAQAVASRPNRGRTLKQTAYALVKIFGARRVILLWPESSQAQHLSTFLARPAEPRPTLPRPLVDLVLHENKAVIWPHVLTQLDFAQGQRRLDIQPLTAMAAPLKAQDGRRGLLYIESGSRAFAARDLNFFNALSGLVSSALINAGLIAQLDYRLAREEEELASGGTFVGEDTQLKALLGTAQQVGQTQARILLAGEVGTGKEVLARRIHAHSPRRRGPFVAINCSTIAAGQLENALFGQEGNESDPDGTPGILEKADGGTVFIRHVDHLAPSAQVELLRTIEEGLVYRVGSTRPRPSDFRTISSTSVDLELLVRRGEFREDLFQRLSEVTLTMPPLRELKGDIVTLTRHFVDRVARENGVPVPELDPALAQCLQVYSWPGNVGELRNLVETLVMFSRGGRIILDDLPLDLRLANQVFRSLDGEAESQTLAEAEKTWILRALARTDGSVTRAAEILNLSERALKELIERYAISEF